MAIRSRSDLTDMLSKLVGERTDDDVITLMEDFNDTMDDYDSRVGEDWKTKYQENDAEWRRKYIARFNGTSADENYQNGQIMTTELQTTETETTEEGQVTWDDILE